MTTPREDIIRYFHTEFQQPKKLDVGLENQFLLKAIGDFELNLSPIEYDESGESFSIDLSLSEQSVLGKLMYKHYLSREKDRILKLNNIVGKDISLTSMGQAKSSIIKASEMLDNEIEKIMNRLKDNSYSG